MDNTLLAVWSLVANVSYQFSLIHNLSLTEYHYSTHCLTTNIVHMTSSGEYIIPTMIIIIVVCYHGDF